jgi:hypothetical protein
MRTTNSHRKQVVGPLAQAADTDWRAIELPLLGTCGVVVHISYRLDAGGTNGALEAKIIDGSYNPATITSTEIAAIPDEDVVAHDASLAMVNSATVSTKTNVVSTSGQAAAYDRRGGEGYSIEDRTLMLVYRGDATLLGNLYVAVRAIHAGR